MKVGDTIVYKTDGSTGVIVAIEQYGNTPTYIVEWSDKCPMTGRKGQSPVLAIEIRGLYESR